MDVLGELQLSFSHVPENCKVTSQGGCSEVKYVLLSAENKRVISQNRYRIWKGSNPSSFLLQAGRQSSFLLGCFVHGEICRNQPSGVDAESGGPKVTRVPWPTFSRVDFFLVLISCWMLTFNCPVNSSPSPGGKNYSGSSREAKKITGPFPRASRADSKCLPEMAPWITPYPRSNWYLGIWSRTKTKVFLT